MISKVTDHTVNQHPTENFLLNYCRKHKVRVTPQRLEVYKVISNMGGHPSAEEIFAVIKQKMPYISLDTVYKNLNFLEKINILSRVRSDHQSASRYEVNHKHHHHFCCEECGHLYDLSWKEFDKLKSPDSDAIGKFNRRTVTLYGICKQCYEK